jgi:hypothetical protein
MSTSTHFTGSIWFVALVALLVSLGAQVLFGALPVTVFDWIDNENRSGPIVLIAGETSFWRGDSIIRAISFGLGALIACFLASSHSWYLIATLILVSFLSTAFAQFPRPATLWQLSLWAASAPVAVLVVSVLYRVGKGDA